jgi:predicted MPP superfamily phosphohydrolase
MYMGSEILMLSPLILYAGFRVWSLLRGKGKRILWAALFLLLILGYPLAESLSHGAGNRWAAGLINAGYITLPLMLYLVLAVLVSDAVIGLGRLTRLLSKEAVRSPRFRRIRLGLLLILPTAVVAFGAWNYGRLQIREYTVEIPRKSAAGPGPTIVFASDFHLQERTARRMMDRFAAKVNAAKPDLVLIGGDIVEGDSRNENLDAPAAVFRRIRSTYGVYGVLGNHDSYGGDPAAFFEKAGIKMLLDKVKKIDGSIYLAGRLDGRARGRTGARKSIDALLADVPDDLPIVVLDHRPTDLDNVGRSRADLQVSGHTHNAQMFPLNIMARREYEIAWGSGVKGRTQVIVSSGIQGWGPPVRTAGASEILVIRVVFRDGR